MHIELGPVRGWSLTFLALDRTYTRSKEEEEEVWRGVGDKIALVFAELDFWVQPITWVPYERPGGRVELG
jgi:hypothetical protein